MTQLSRTNHVISADAHITDYSRVNLIRITENQHLQRLDNFLLARLKGLPKSHLYKLIRKDEVRVNKARVTPDYKLKNGDVVRLAPVRLPAREQIFISDAFASGLLERIVYEDDAIIVLNKPSGMAVHGGSGVSFGVIEALRKATGKKYLELAHRIDKDTSGLLLIAKKRSVLRVIQEDFRQKRIIKTYQALVYGTVLKDFQTVNAPLERYLVGGGGAQSANNTGERRVRVSAMGKPSETDIKVIERFANTTLIHAMPKTGRTHQIRVHGLHIGHPLLGDDKYHAGDTSSAKRLCLHAHKLSIPNFGKFEAAMPQDMLKLMAQLRKQ